MANIENNELAQQLLCIVGKHSIFPETLVTAQCRRHLDKRLANITKADLPTLARYVSEAVAKFTNPGKGAELKREIFKLIQDDSG